MSQLLFNTMLAFFLTHELDAMKRHEWRMFPLLSRLPEKIGEQVFVWAHVPLLYTLFSIEDGAASVFAQSLSAFAVFHLALHWLFRNHRANEFNNLSSWLLIFGAGLIGGAHLLAVYA